MLKKLSIEGYIIILVSHKLDEVFELCKEATILKNGSKIKTIPIPFERKKIVELMFKGDKSIDKIENPISRIKRENMHIDLKYYKKGIAKIPEGKKIGDIKTEATYTYQYEKGDGSDYDLLNDGSELDNIEMIAKLGKKDAMYISVIQQLITRVETLETEVTALKGE